MNLDRIINIIRNLNEEAMTVGGGGVAGLEPDDPPVFKKKKKPPILARGKMPGARKRWREGL